MAITAQQASNVRLLWDRGFDTFAIAAEFNLTESEVYNYVAAWIERKANRCRDIRSSFAALDSKTASSSGFQATASQQA